MNKPMRMLVLGPQLSDEDLQDIAECGIAAEVSHFDVVQCLASMSRADATRHTLTLVDHLRPDLIFCNIGVANEKRWLDFSFNDEVRRRGIRIAGFFCDSWPNLNACELSWLMKSDYYVLTDRYTNYDKFSRLCQTLKLQTKVYYWPTMNHIVKHYAQLQHSEKLYDATFLGRTPTPWRKALVDYLAQALPQQGFSFSHLNPNNDLSNRGYAQAIMQSRISINCLTSLAGTFQMKWRIQELVASSAMPLIEDNPESRKLLPPGCAVYYDGLQDCADKAAYYLRHPAEREQIARNGAQWFADNFDAQDQWRRLFISCQCEG